MPATEGCSWTRGEIIEARAGLGNALLCHCGTAEDSTQAEQPFFTRDEKEREGKRREGERGVELVPNVWWQAVARKSES